MKENIKLSDICVSPHRETYEQFLQIDSFIKSEPLNADTGPFKLISSIFPISHSSEELLGKIMQVYPKHRSNKKSTISPEQIEETMSLQLPATLTFYAFKDIKFPGSDGDVIVNAGEQITAEATEKICSYNKRCLGGETKPLKTISYINPELPQEKNVVAELIKTEDFNAELLKKKKKVTVSVKSYELEFPFNIDPKTERHHYLKQLYDEEWACRRSRRTLRMSVYLHLKIKESIKLNYKEESFPIRENSFKKKALLGHFPIFTENDSFIINGLERFPICQLLTGPGVHLKCYEDNDPTQYDRLGVLVRPRKGPFLELVVTHNNENDKKHVTVLIGNKQCDFIFFLNTVGIFNNVAKMVTKAGLKMPEPSQDPQFLNPILSPHEVGQIYTLLFKSGDGYELGESVRQNINERLNDIYRTVNDSFCPPGAAINYLTDKDIAALFIYLLQCDEQDDPDCDDPLDLARSAILTIKDKIEDKIKIFLPKLEKRMTFFLKNSDDLSRLPLIFSKTLSETIDPIFYGELCQINYGINPLSELSLKRKVTLMGPGGVHNDYVNMKRRGVHASHYGRLCLTETPESKSIGLNLHLALAAKVEKGNIQTPYIDTENKIVWLTPEQELNSDSNFVPKAYEQYQEQDKKFLTRSKKGNIEKKKITEINLKKDKYQGQFLGIGANLIPFVQHNENNRVMMGAKNMKQAVPLLNPEAPLIKTGREDLVGKLTRHAVFDRAPGKVESVTKDQIKINTDNGAVEHYQIKPIRPTFSNTITRQLPLVKKGDEISKGQAIIDGACTRNGELSLGINLLVAYMPYYGLNFEDGIVISNRLVKEDILTSLHLGSFEFDVYGNENMTSNSQDLNMINFSLYKGIMCYKGMEVKKGDTLFGKYRKNGMKYEPEWFRSPVNGTIIEISTEYINPVDKSPERIRYKKICLILEERKINVGDKLMGRHGNKGVVSRILPSETMPHLKDGTPVDIILNPHGVISRMNLGQILETHLGWIVHHGRDKLKGIETIAPFERVDEDKLKQCFKKLKYTGIDEQGKTELIDGQSGQKIENRVVVGYQYFLKLNHFAEDKINIRESGQYTLITKQPPKGKKFKGGQRMGEMEVWALQAHMCQNLLQEFLTLKSDVLELRKHDLTKEYFKKDSPITDYIPFQETLKATTILLRGLSLNMVFYDSNNNELTHENNDLTGLDKVKISIADEMQIKKWAENKAVTNFSKPYIKNGQLKAAKNGIIDPAIFSNKRNSMGFIELAEPVINPLFKNKIQNHIKHKWLKEFVLDYAGAFIARKILKENNDDSLEKLFIKNIPVIPLDYRPLWSTHGKIKVKSELNSFYIDILKANQMLRQALEKKNISDIKLFYLRSWLQLTVNRLMVGDIKSARKNQKSIGDRIKGKEGILRMHHLGKHVDVSARSVIVPYPELELDQVGIPLDMAVKIMKSSLVEHLSKKCNGNSTKEKKANAELIIKKIDSPYNRDFIKKHLFNDEEALLKDIKIVLTRAPSLHKYNLLAFRPVCVDHKAIGLHPLACKFFNADFDGDAMGVFMPLSKQALAEAKERLSPVQNLFSTANGSIMLHFSQDIVLGIYLLTSNREGRKIYNDLFECANIEPVKTPVNGKNLVENLFKYYLAVEDIEKITEISQKIMKEGFRQATLSGLTFSIFDVPILEEQKKLCLIKDKQKKEWNKIISRKMADDCGIEHE